MVVWSCDPNTQEAEAGGLLPVWVCPGIPSGYLFLTTKGSSLFDSFTSWGFHLTVYKSTSIPILPWTEMHLEQYILLSSSQYLSSMIDQYLPVYHLNTICYVKNHLVGLNVGSRSSARWLLSLWDLKVKHFLFLYKLEDWSTGCLWEVWLPRGVLQEPNISGPLQEQVWPVPVDSRAVSGSSWASLCFLEWTLSLDGFSCCRGEQPLSVPQCQPSDCLYPHPPGPLRECSPWRWPLGKISFPLQGPAILSNPVTPACSSTTLSIATLYNHVQSSWNVVRTPDPASIECSLVDNIKLLFYLMVLRSHPFLKQFHQIALLGYWCHLFVLREAVSLELIMYQNAGF